jgi:hypothetical protein
MLTAFLVPDARVLTSAAAVRSVWREGFRVA